MLRTLNRLYLSKLINFNKINNNQCCILSKLEFSSKSDGKKGPPVKAADKKAPDNKSPANNPKLDAKATDVTKPPDNKLPEGCLPVTKSVTVMKQDDITIICINRPKLKNAVDFLTSQLLIKEISNFEEDPKSKVAVLHGSCGIFCSGVDINEYTTEKIHPELLFLREGTVGPTRRHTKKPIICAIEGVCATQGFELAMLCDLRVMDECAKIGFLNRRFGIPLLDGGSNRLQAMVGLSNALDLILTGRLVESKEALSMGLVNRVVANGTAIGQAINLALCIAKFPQKALLHDRNSVLYAAYDSTSFDSSIEQEVMKTSKNIIEEAQQGAKRFIDGIGRHGSSTNVTERNIPDWERSEIEHEINYEKTLDENKKNEK